MPIEILFVLLLILANGVFSMAEIAVLSARKLRLQQRAERGDKGARAALALAESPDRFLSTVQMGITLVGILTGVFGGATIAEELSDWLKAVPRLAPYAEAIGVGTVVLTITYLTLVLGELVPKRIALAHAEAIAARTAEPFTMLARAAGPVVGFLSASTSAVARLFGVRGMREDTVTEEEVRHLLAQGTDAGVFEPAEQTMVERVFRFTDRKIDALMTRRADVVWLDLEDTPGVIADKLAANAHSRFPVAEGNLDHLVGLVFARELLGQIIGGAPPDLRTLIRKPLYLPEHLPAPAALEQMREHHQHVAFVVDEYGTFQGLLTVSDLMEAVVGDMPRTDGVPDPAVVRRDDGSLLVDGTLSLEALHDLLPLGELPAEGFQTLGGLVMGVLQRVPKAGDRFEIGGFRFEVVDMDELRVDKILIAPIARS